MKYPEEVICKCGFVIFTGLVLRARILRFECDCGVARCKRCKREVVISNIRLSRDDKDGGR